jgi:predicted PurR-regulated permease PerM
MADRDARPRERTPDQLAVDIAVRLGILALFAWVVLLLVRPFLPILLWSIVLTVAFQPAHAWLTARLGGRGWWAAAALTALALGLAIGPATVLVTSAIHSLELLARWVAAGHHDFPDPPRQVAGLPVVGPAIEQTWRQASSNLEVFVERYGRALIGPGEWLLHAIAGLAGSVVAILVAVLVSGFLYVPAPRLVRGLRVVAERIIGHHRGIAFLDLAAATIRNVARGIIGVAIVQSLLIGLAFIVAGVPAAGLLSLAVLVLAIVQLGAFPIVVPVLVWAWFSLGTGEALLLTAYLVPAALSDMALKPLLMGKGLPVPLLVILAGVVGGTVSYGLIGLFLGPIVLAVFYELVRFWVTAEPVDAGADAPGGIE